MVVVKAKKIGGGGGLDAPTGDVKKIKSVKNAANSSMRQISQTKSNPNSVDSKALKNNDPSKVEPGGPIDNLNKVRNSAFGKDGAMASVTGTSDPLSDPNFAKDLDGMSKDPAFEPKTAAGKKLKKLRDKLDPQKKADVDKGIADWKKLGLAGAGIGALFGFLQLMAEAKTGCYIITKDNKQLMSCKQKDCSVGNTCGDASGNPISGRCCSGGGMASKGSTCSCIEKSMLDAAEDFAGSMSKAMDALLDALPEGIDFLTSLIEYWPYIAIAVAAIMFGLPLLKTIFSVVSAVTPKGSDSGGTQKIIVTTQPTPQPFIDCSSGWAKYRPECAGKS
jgi:hypothetical protein